MEDSGGQHVVGRRRKGRAAVVPGLAVLAVGVGFMLALNGDAQTSYGWFAYAPLSNETFTGGGLTILGPWTKVGVSVAAAGLLVLAFWSGYRTARRRTR